MSLNQNGECALSTCTRRLNGSLLGNGSGAAGSSQAFREMRPPQEEGNGSFLTQGGSSVFTEGTCRQIRAQVLPLPLA